jgi:hypothetical protein
MLRLYSTRDQGGSPSSSQTAQLERFLRYLGDHGVVVDYDKEVGFGWRKRRAGEVGPIPSVMQTSRPSVRHNRYGGGVRHAA